MEIKHEFFWFTAVTILSAIVSFVTLKFVIKFAFSKNLLDISDSRKRHGGEIPSLGGLSIYIPLLLVLIGISIAASSWVFMVFALMATFIVALGLYDDIVPLNASKKFLGQLLISSIAVFLLYNRYHDLFAIVFLNNDWITLGILVFSFIFLMNAYNLIDGIDGLSGGLAMISCLFYTAWFYQSGNYFHAFMSVSIVASLIVFLKYNVLDRAIFLGDNGSMLLGLIIGILGVEFLFLRQTAVHFLQFNSPIAFVAAMVFIPVFDVIRLFIIRILVLEKSPFKPDRNHIHHLVIRLGFSHLHATMALLFLAIVIIGLTFILDNMGNLYVLVILSMTMSAFVLFSDGLLHYKYRGRVAKKTMFSEISKFRKKLKKPRITDFIFGFAIYLLFVSIPFFRVATTIPTLILVLLMFTIILKTMYDKGKIPKPLKSGFNEFFKHKFTLLLATFVFIHMIWAIVVSPQSFQYSSISLLVLMFLFWGIMFFQFYTIRIYLSDIFSAYVLGCFAFGVYIVLAGIQDIPKEGFSALYYTNLLNNVQGNPIIHSLYFNLAILFLFHSGFHTRTKYKKSFIIITICFFTGLILLFGSKIGYLALLLSLSYVIWKEIPQTKTRAILISSILGVLFTIYLTVPFVNLRVNDFGSKLFSSTELHMDQELPRKIVWQKAIELVKEKPILGYGTGTTRDILYKKYEELGWHRGKVFRYNAHNQYLETWLQTGLLGLVMLLAILFYSISLAWRKKNFLHLVVLAIIMTYMMFESLFATQMGAVAFGLFNALFITNYYLQDLQIRSLRKAKPLSAGKD